MNGKMVLFAFALLLACCSGAPQADEIFNAQDKSELIAPVIDVDKHKTTEVTTVVTETTTNSTTNDTTTEIPTTAPITTSTDIPTTIPLTTTVAPTTTTVAPRTTTVAPTTSTVAPTTASTTTEAPTSTSEPSTTTEQPQPEPCRRFDPLSFIGGIVLTMGLFAIAFVIHKYYKSRTERNYHTL